MKHRLTAAELTKKSQEDVDALMASGLTRAQAVEKSIENRTGTSPSEYLRQIARHQAEAEYAAAHAPGRRGVRGISQATAQDVEAGFVARRSTKARVFVAATGLTGYVLTRKTEAESVATGKRFKRAK